VNHIPSPIPKTSDEWLERDIKAAGADKAPRITPADIEANIASEHYFTAADGCAGAYGAEMYPATDDEIGTTKVVEVIKIDPTLGLLTFCVLVLRNGFTVTGESACASPENFNAEIGRKIARENAVAKVWPLMGYELRSKLAAEPSPEPDFLTGTQACDLSGEGTCEACQ
jgi:Phage protein (N4 Gp49/phage Sf6 gene 66) family